MSAGLPFYHEKIKKTYHLVYSYVWPCRNRTSLTMLAVFAVSLFLCTVYLSSRVSSLKHFRHSFSESLERVINASLEVNKFNHTHAFITSAYYYENSKSLGENALAMVVVMSQRTYEDLEKYEMTIVASRGNKSYRSRATIKKETPSDMFCEYVMVLVQATTLSNPQTLEIESGGSSVEIPFRKPREWSHSPVIMCISPQFVAEKWQVFLMNIHVIRRYGGHMHVYITSMVQELFETLKVYENWGSVTLDYWVRMKFKETLTPYTEPMRSVEWRNQAGAQTDCLLQYKEVADFIAFFDIDDILIPRLSHNYHHEFSSHFDAFPKHHSIFYTKRDVGIQTVHNAVDFSFRQLFSTMDIRNETGYGKSIVNPLRYNSTWIHHSFQLPRNRMYKVLNTELIHVKDVLEEQLNTSAPYRPPMMFNTLGDPLVREADLNSLDRDFLDAWGDAHYRETAAKMVDHNYYGPIVFQCYNDSFYHPFFSENKSFDVLCPNADSCILPQREDIKCVHSDAEYVSGPEMFPITFHYAVKPYWSRDIGCFQ